jgi:hypothetical protein
MSAIKHLREEISERQEKIHQIQEECSHPKSCITKEAKSDAGGYDNSMYDNYWYNLTCGLCEKQWTEDQKEYNLKEFHSK